MNVKNRHCIRRLSLCQFKAARNRNLISIAAIALTTLLFTTLFTIALSVNSSYEEYQFRQIGGYSHGSFKDVSEEQIEALSSHSKVKQYGIRTLLGFVTEPPFAKTVAEVSYMDENSAAWSYINLIEGHIPVSDDEIIMDTLALEKLGIPARLGEKVELTYTIENDSFRQERTDSFVLSGFWEYDTLMPVHYINVSKAYAGRIAAECAGQGAGTFLSDMNVMLSSSLNIQHTMESIDTDLGYQWEDRTADNCVRIGVNWGYSASELGSSIDMSIVLSIAAFIVLVVFTGYLIIYNIFRISVSNDIRFYGLLKTIGTTPRQLKRLIRYQAMILSIIGIPIGCLIGYLIGSVLVPIVMADTIMSSVAAASSSPLIFILSAVFALVTVLLSCRKPGYMASGISPVEAVRYTEAPLGNRKKRTTRKVSLSQMAAANLGRSRSRTVLVLLSLSLAVILLNSVYAVTKGFDMEKYVSNNLQADFIVGTTDYFHFSLDEESVNLPDDIVSEIEENTEYSLSGSGYTSGYTTLCLTSEEQWISINSRFGITEDAADSLTENESFIETRLLLEGLDESLFEKLTVLDGDISPLFDENLHSIAIAVNVDDYGNVIGTYPEVGTILPVCYIEEIRTYDIRTGELSSADTPTEYMDARMEKSHYIDYTVSAIVEVPYCMSYRYSLNGLEAVLTRDALKRDSNGELYRLFYLMDTPEEDQTEAFLADLTAGDSSGLMYESKRLIRDEFTSFRNMFTLVGGILCFIIGLVGILNFFNAVMTGIMSRRREFAMLQSVGMTDHQLEMMLVYEGLYYALGAILISVILSVMFEPCIGMVLERMWWFYSYKFSITPMVFIVPVFILLGVVLPLAVHHFSAGKSIVERLRESE